MSISSHFLCIYCEGACSYLCVCAHTRDTHCTMRCFSFSQETILFTFPSNNAEYTCRFIIPQWIQIIWTLHFFLQIQQGRYITAFYLHFPDSWSKWACFTPFNGLCSLLKVISVFVSLTDLSVYLCCLIFLHLFIGQTHLKLYYTDSAIIFSNLTIFFYLLKFLMELFDAWNRAL